MTSDSMAALKVNSESKGPLSYENWRSAMQKCPASCGGEVPLFTDVHVTGQIEMGLGPYQFFNTLASAAREPNWNEPAIVLRYFLHLSDPDPGQLTKTDVGTYHGGDVFDEIAALASLCMGIRLKAGPEIRSFSGFITDPLGRPLYLSHKPNPEVPKCRAEPILPNCRRSSELNSSLPLFSTFPALKCNEATAIVRAARSYQEALWVAESQPHLAWLFLVSAVEVVGNLWRTQSYTSLEKLDFSRPELAALLREKGDEQWVITIANQIAPYIGATKGFVDFLIEFLPAAPEANTRLNGHSWDEKELTKSFKLIYNWRSKALHGGTPFPFPMCDAPNQMNGRISECPDALAMATRGGVWVNKDTPMLLHLFEYIVRGALHNWWKSRVPSPIPVAIGREAATGN
jgi:hypothetical protein